jgi:hypothetical protein
MFSREPIGAIGLTGSANNVPNIAHFPQKSMIYAQSGRFGAVFGYISAIRVKLKPEFG